MSGDLLFFHRNIIFGRFRFGIPVTSRLKKIAYGNWDFLSNFKAVSAELCDKSPSCSRATTWTIAWGERWYKSKTAHTSPQSRDPKPLISSSSSRRKLSKSQRHEACQVRGEPNQEICKICNYLRNWFPPQLISSRISHIKKWKLTSAHRNVFHKEQNCFAWETDPFTGRASCWSKCTAIGKHHSPLQPCHLSRAKKCCRDALFLRKNYCRHFSKCDRDEWTFSRVWAWRGMTSKRGNGLTLGRFPGRGFASAMYLVWLLALVEKSCPWGALRCSVGAASQRLDTFSRIFRILIHRIEC